MRKERFYRDKKAVKRSVSGIYLVLFLALQITGCSQTADQDKAAQKTGQARRTEKEGVGAKKSSAETERNGSGTGEAGWEQSTGNSQADAKVAAGQGDSVIEFKPGMPIKEGVAASDFTGELMGGTSITPSELQGKPVIINFWATWYGLCVKEMPVSGRLKDDSGDKISTTAANCGDDAETVKDFVEENGYTFPVVLDEGYFISMPYPTNPTPYAAVLDTEGKVARIFTGALDVDIMCERCKEALGA